MAVGFVSYVQHHIIVTKMLSMMLNKVFLSFFLTFVHILPFLTFDPNVPTADWLKIFPWTHVHSSRFDPEAKLKACLMDALKSLLPDKFIMSLTSVLP